MQNLKISSGSMSKFFEIYKPLKIENPNGDIFRVLRNDEKSFEEFLISISSELNVPLISSQEVFYILSLIHI